VVEPDGSIKSTIVCLRCALRAIVLVTPPPTTLPPLCGVCKRDHASVCVSCYGRVAESNRELTNANVALRLVKAD
jgi:hypothetical protein